MALCCVNGGLWRFLLKYLITVHHTHLVLEQLQKDEWPFHLLNDKMSKDYYVCEIKKAFD